MHVESSPHIPVAHGSIGTQSSCNGLLVAEAYPVLQVHRETFASMYVHTPFMQPPLLVAQLLMGLQLDPGPGMYPGSHAHATEAAEVWRQTVLAPQPPLVTLHTIRSS